MKQPIITILAHLAAEDIVDRHMPLWKTHGWPIQVFVPIHDKHLAEQRWSVKYGVQVVGVGEGGQGGTVETAQRIVTTFMELADTRDVSHHVILEYDSFFTAPPQLRNGVSGILFQNAESPKYTAPVYPNPPWIIDSESLKDMAEWFDRFHDICELGHMDRLIAAAANGVGIPILPYDPPGFSRGTIDMGNHLTDFSMLLNAINAGAFAFHGVKTNSILESILRLIFARKGGIDVSPSGILASILV